MARFLIVDDDPQLLDLYSLFLSRDRHEVVGAANAFEAIDHLYNQTFDVALIDATMPFVSGFDLVERIKRSPRFQSLVVSMITARNSKSDVQRAIRSGATEYIVKPIKEPEFLEKVRKLVSMIPASNERTISGYQSQDDSHAWVTLQVEVEAINEKFITLMSQSPLPEAAMVKVQNPIIQRFRLDSDFLKVIRSVKDAKHGVVRSELAFVGLTDDQRSTIKMWAEMEKKRNAKKSA